MNVSRMKILCVKIFKTINYINPKFMNENFLSERKWDAGRERHKLNLEVPSETRSHVRKIFSKVLCEKIWNNLPYYVIFNVISRS